MAASTRAASKAQIPAGAAPAVGEPGEVVLAGVAGNDQVGSVAAGPRHATHEAARVDRCGVAGLRRGQARGGEHVRGGGADEAQHGPARGDVHRFDALQEAHLLQVVDHCRRGARFGVDPHRAVSAAAQLDELPVLLDVTVR